ncbi:MAG: hypothetical protein AAF800_00230 [Planctomycetota bacterium]
MNLNPTPPPNIDPVDAAVADAARHINRGVARRAACVALTLAGGGALACGVAYWWAGHRVAAWVYAAAALAGLAVFLGLWACRRVDHARAAVDIDRAFSLADGVSTARSLARKPGGETSPTGGFAALQKRWADRAVRGLRLETLRPATPRWLAGAAVALPALAVLLGFVPPSETVRAAQREAAVVLALGEELNAGVRDEVERHLDEADELEREALDPASLRELAERLGVSEDRAELMRQYAAMEAELAQRSAALEQRRAEGLMDRAAARLAQSPSTLALAEALRQKRYTDAAEVLKQMQPDPEADPAKRRQQLQKLRQAAGELAEAARRFRAGSGAGTSGGGGGLGDQLATLSEQLDADAREYDESLREAERQQNRGELSEETKRRLSECEGRCNATNAALQKSLCKLGACRAAGDRLAQIRRTLSMCQGACSGVGRSPFAKKNGSGVGSGSVDSPNDTATPGTGRLDRITGVKGAGPSQTEVEEAASGTGVSTRRDTAPTVEHTRRLESFVQRPDVPDELRQGVKTYFESLHDTPAPGNATPDNATAETLDP